MFLAELTQFYTFLSPVSPRRTDEQTDTQTDSQNA